MVPRFRVSVKRYHHHILPKTFRMVHDVSIPKNPEMYDCCLIDPKWKS